MARDNLLAEEDAGAARVHETIAIPRRLVVEEVEQLAGYDMLMVTIPRTAAFDAGGYVLEVPSYRTWRSGRVLHIDDAGYRDGKYLARYNHPAKGTRHKRYWLSFAELREAYAAEIAEVKAWDAGVVLRKRSAVDGGGRIVVARHGHGEGRYATRRSIGIIPDESEHFYDLEFLKGLETNAPARRGRHDIAARRFNVETEIASYDDVDTVLGFLGELSPVQDALSAADSIYVSWTRMSLESLVHELNGLVGSPQFDRILEAYDKTCSEIEAEPHRRIGILLDAWKSKV